MEADAGTLTSALDLLQQGSVVLWWRIAADVLAVATALMLAMGAALALAVFLVRARFPGRMLLIALVRCSLFVPTVVLGVGALWLLSEGLIAPNWATFTLLLAVVAMPVPAALLIGVLRSADPRAWETAITLGASPLRAALAQLRDQRPALRATLLVAAGRVTAEAGCAALVWGGGGTEASNCFGTGLVGCGGAESVALSIVLLAVALVVNLLIAWRETRLETTARP